MMLLLEISGSSVLCWRNFGIDKCIMLVDIVKGCVEIHWLIAWLLMAKNTEKMLDINIQKLSFDGSPSPLKPLPSIV